MDYSKAQVQFKSIGLSMKTQKQTNPKRKSNPKVQAKPANTIMNYLEVQAQACKHKNGLSISENLI